MASAKIEPKEAPMVIPPKRPAFIIPQLALKFSSFDVAATIALIQYFIKAKPMPQNALRAISLYGEETVVQAMLPSIKNGNTKTIIRLSFILSYNFWITADARSTQRSSTVSGIEALTDFERPKMLASHFLMMTAAYGRLM